MPPGDGVAGLSHLHGWGFAADSRQACRGGCLSESPAETGRAIVIGASAGGVEALSFLASRFPRDLEAPVFIVLHIPHNATSYMPQILSRAGDLPARHPREREKFRNGVIYVAPPDRHLLISKDYVSTDYGPRENGHRPAVDPLFRSAASSFASGAIGIVLSGNLDDGTAGLAAIKSRGGVAIVQEPTETAYPSMPLSAIENVKVDHVLTLNEIVPAILRLLSGPELPRGPDMTNDELEQEVRDAQLDPELAKSDDQPGEPSGFSCPECSGGLWEVHEGKLVRYRCRVGHAYSADSLLSASGSQVEAALWAGLRSLEENAAFARRLARRAKTLRQDGVAHRFAAQANRTSQHAITLRSILLSGPVNAEPELPKVTAPE